MSAAVLIGALLTPASVSAATAATRGGEETERAQIIALKSAADPTRALALADVEGQLIPVLSPAGQPGAGMVFHDLGDQQFVIAIADGAAIVPQGDVLNLREESTVEEAATDVASHWSVNDRGNGQVSIHAVIEGENAFVTSIPESSAVVLAPEAESSGTGRERQLWIIDDSVPEQVTPTERASAETIDFVPSLAVATPVDEQENGASGAGVDESANVLRDMEVHWDFIYRDTTPIALTDGVRDAIGFKDWRRGGPSNLVNPNAATAYFPMPREIDGVGVWDMNGKQNIGEVTVQYRDIIGGWADLPAIDQAWPHINSEPDLAVVLRSEQVTATAIRVIIAPQSQSLWMSLSEIEVYGPELEG
ncbi:hypothetical protein [Microbacterium marmarense]|uniref:Uncharacterized protein n=1 Tax=Microbacterium marmarense TaxID=3122051 RepID=A0ABU8LQU6_9MICO